jgi:tetratricopeptide (TPR) repeat protein
LRELGPSPQAGETPRRVGEALMNLRRAEISLDLGKVPGAVAELRKFRSPEASPDIQVFFGVLSARAGNLSQAESVVQWMQSDAEFRQSPPASARLKQLQAEIAMARGRPSEALDAAQQAARVYNSTFVLETLARAQVAAGDREAAATSYRNLLSRAEERTLEIDQFAYFHAVRAHYELGRVLEELGQPAAALEHYREFLRWWEEADPDVPAFRDARRRFGQGAQSKPAGRVPTPAA